MLSLSLRRLALSIAALALPVCYLLLAPTAIGGPVTYVKVFGGSMEPSLHAGDLVLARRAATYSRGDVTVYRNADLGMVLHRIVGYDQDRFILQGDANSWTDSDHPLPAEIAGKFWVRLPMVGYILNLVRPPWGTLVLVLPGFAAVAHAVLRRQTRPTDVGRRGRQPPRPAGTPPLTMYSPLGATLSVVCAVGVLGSIIVGGYAWLHPETALTPAPEAYEQRGAFGYSAPAPPEIYETGMIRPGDPVYIKVTDSIAIVFEYEVRSEVLRDFEGAGRMVAVLSQANGWERVFPLSDAVAFTGASITMAGTLDLRRLRQLITDIESTTSVTYETYRLAFAPDVETRSGGRPLAPFAPRLVFRFSSTELQLERHEGTPVPIAVSSPATLQRMIVTPATVSALGLSARIAALRWWSPAIGVAALGGLLLLTWLTHRSTRDEARRIEVQYGTLVTVAHLVRRPNQSPLLSVEQFDELAEIARSQGLPVIRDAADLDQFYVLTRDGTFHYRLPGMPVRMARRPRRQTAA